MIRREKSYEKELKIYEKEIDWLKDIIKDISEDIEEHGKMLQLYEEELIRLENENKILTLIIESLKLYEGKNVWKEILL